MFGRKGQDEALAPVDEPNRQAASPDRWAAALEEAFRETAQAAAYVPRDASERVLQQLQTCVVESAVPAALSATPGMGKSMLLRVLAERLRDRHRCVFLPYGSLSLVDLCAWSLGLMGESRANDPVQALLSLARELHSDGKALVLLIDDASGLQLEPARELSALWAEASGALQLVLTSPDDACGDRVFAALGASVCRIRFCDPMTFAETHEFVRGRLNRAAVPKVTLNRFDRACIEWIHAQSGGVPRLAQRLAQQILMDQPPDVTPNGHHNGHHDDDWLGAPLDELSHTNRHR